MIRKEFDRATKAEIMRRAKVPTGFQCEECGSIVTKGEIHHLKSDAFVVEKKKLTAKDGAFLCKPCHDFETKANSGPIAKAKRQEAADLGIKRESSRPMPRLPKPEKPPSDKLPLPPRRPMFT